MCFINVTYGPHYCILCSLDLAQQHLAFALLLYVHIVHVGLCICIVCNKLVLLLVLVLLLLYVFKRRVIVCETSLSPRH